MVRLISRQRRTSACFKLTKLFDIDDFSVAKDSGNVLIIIIYCYLIIIDSPKPHKKGSTQNYDFYIEVCLSCAHIKPSCQLLTS